MHDAGQDHGLREGSGDGLGEARARFGTVRGRWRDRQGGATREILEKAADKGPVKTPREVYQSEAECRCAVSAEVKSVRASEAELMLSVVGNPDARAEARGTMAGVSLDADGSRVCKQAVHRWSFRAGGGATTEMICEHGANGAKSTV